MNRLWVFITLVTTSAAAAVGVRAQEPDTVRLSPVVITATRLALPRASVAATVTVLDGDELRARGVRYVADALRDVAGLHVVQTGSFGGGTSLFLRGGESDYAKILVDGVALNDPGGAFDLANLTIDNVERIEIVRGPASVVYGSDAVAGVVQVFTRRGAGRPRGNVGAQGGTFGSVMIDAGFSGGTEHVNYALAYSRSTSDGIFDFNNDFRNVVWSGLVRAAPDERTEAKLSLRYSDSKFHFPTDGSGRLVDQNQFRLQERTSLAIEVGRYLHERVEGRVLLALNELDAAIDDEPDGAADTLGFYAFNSLQAVVRRSADARVNVYAASWAIVTLGAQLEEQRQRDFSETQSQFGQFISVGDQERLNRGYYGQLHAEPVRGLGFTVGTRVDDNEAFGTFVTGRAGVTYRFPSATRIRTSVGTAFKEPTFFENFSQSPFARGNVDLDPERSVSWELGAEQEWLDGRIWISGTYFDQRFRDLIQFTAVTASPSDPHFFNVAEADASGFELEVRGVALSSLTLGASYTYLTTNVVDAGLDTDGLQFVTGEPLLRRPEHAFGVDAAYRWREQGGASARLNYVGERSDRDFATFPAASVTLPSYVTVDVAAEVVVLQRAGAVPGVTLTGRVANLLDKEYQAVFGFPAPGRTIWLGGKVGL